MMDPKYQQGDLVRLKASEDVWEVARIGKVGPYADEPQYAVTSGEQRRVVRESLITEKVGDVSG